LELQTQAKCAMDFLSVKFYPCIFSFNHIQDCINRLSAPLPPASESPLPGSDEDLTESAIALLRNGVALNVEAWQVAVDKEPDASASLKLFFQCPEVVQHRVWKQVFGATPPRGVVARLARRLGPRSSGPFQHRLFQLSPQSRLPERNSTHLDIALEEEKFGVLHPSGKESCDRWLPGRSRGAQVVLGL
jgi:hypothetical protein